MQGLFIALITLIIMFAPGILITLLVLKLLKKYINKRTKTNDYNSQHNYQDKKKWSPTGWYWDEKKQLWVPPDYIDSRKNTKVHNYQAFTQAEQDKRIRLSKDGPTFEEWKAAKMKHPPDGAYHYDYIHIPNNETITEVKILKPNITVTKEPKKKDDKNVPEAKNSVKISSDPNESYNYRGKDITDEWIRVTRNNIPRPGEQAKATTEKTKYNEPETSSPKTVKQETKEYDIQSKNSANNYEAKSILTYNEKRNYKTLKEAADKKGYTVQLKPRMADIAGSRIKDRRDKQFWVNFNKISQKHVDFAILDENLRIIAIIELDDNSHDTPKAKERDAFKDSVLKDCGYKVIHTRYIWPDILDNI